MRPRKYRAAKLASLGRHLKEVETLNADIGNTVDELQAAFIKLSEEKGEKDPVLCIEHIFPLPPDVRTNKDFNWKKYFKDAVEWMKGRHGKRFIGATIHHDKTAPHMHVYIEDGTD